MKTLRKDRAALRRLALGQAAVDGDVVPLIRRGTWVILVLLWVFGSLLAVFSGWILLLHARSHTAATAISLEQYVRRTMTVAAFAADEYKEFLDARGGMADAGRDPANAAKLAALVKWLPDGSNMGLVGPDGNFVASSLPIPIQPVRATDRRWFKAHAVDGLDSFIGPAILTRVSKRFVFTYTESYRDAAGRLLGVVSLGIPSGSITGLSTEQHNTRMALVQGDGYIVAALPFHPDMIETPLSLPFAPPKVEATEFADAFGHWSVVTVRNIPDLRLDAVVAVPVREVLQPLILGVGIGLPLLLLLTNLLFLLSNQLQKKSREVEQALSDNKVLFQEVHHRVKNNLQVVSSLLRLQTERLPPELRPLLDETGARVRAIALVHEQIYRTASPSDVQLDRFLAQLVQQLSASMIGGAAKISTELQPVTIGLDRAVPVAILASEAITNAIKHGLVNGAGEIGVALSSAEGVNRLEVRDSGPGTGEDAKSGLGTRIMTALSRQIDGEWSLKSVASGCTVFTLTWPA